MKRFVLIAAFVLLRSQSGFAQSFTYKNACTGGTSTFADSVSCSITGTGVSSGDLVVAWLGWGIDGLSPSISDTSSTFSPATANNSITWSQAHGQFFYVLSSVATGTPTYTATVTGAYEPEIIVWIFTPSAAATFDIDVATESLGFAGSTSPDSNVLITTGKNELVIGGLMTENNSTPVTDQAIGGSSATTNAVSAAYPSFTVASWYLATIGTIRATATLNSSQKWLINEIAFKADAGGGGGSTPSRLTTLGAGN